MVFEKKKETGMRCIKMENWYVILTPTSDGTKQIFEAQYYENGLEKITFRVSDTYSFSSVKRTKLKRDETIAVLDKMNAFLKVFQQIDELEKIEKESN